MKLSSQCSHFTMNKNTGWCYLKQGSVTEGKDWSYQNAICGYIKGRNGKEVDLQWNDSGAVRWAMNCVLNGNDFVQFPSTVERCGPVCVLHGYNQSPNHETPSRFLLIILIRYFKCLYTLHMGTPRRRNLLFETRKSVGRICNTFERFCLWLHQKSNGSRRKHRWKTQR